MLGFTKKVVGLSISLTLLFTTYASFAQTSKGVGYINGKDINLRTNPSKTSKVVGLLSGQKVNIHGESGDWYEVSLGKTKGWVKKDFVTIKTQPKKNKKVENKNDGSKLSNIQNPCIKGENINIRSLPSKDSKVIAKLSNLKVKIIDESGDWYKISSNKTRGWIRKDFIVSKGTQEKTAKVSETAASPSSEESVKEYSAKIDGTDINIRSKPTKNSKIVAKLSNKNVSIIAKSGDWYKIKYKNTSGWIKKDFIVSANLSSSTKKSTESNQKNVLAKTDVSESKKGRIIGNNVNIRSKPTKTAKVVAKLSNSSIRVLAQSSKWYKVSNGKITGWVTKDFVSTGSSIAKHTTSSLRNRMVVYSRSFVGVPYRWGGSSPRGFDCSGFTSYIYRRFGINIDRISTDQATQGKYVKKSNLRPGDLVFFDTNGGKKKSVNHAGMYVGDGKFIHASSSKRGKVVKVSSLNEGFYQKTYVCGRSFVK